MTTSFLSWWSFLLYMKNSSFKIWQGCSPYNGKSISAIITNILRKSKNPKTGDMCQLWILSTDLSPVDAVKLGDESVCGDCPLMPARCEVYNESCYVARRAFQAPGNVWKDNINLDVDLDSALYNLTLSGKPIRLGSYGDPAFLPQDIVEKVIEKEKVIENISVKSNKLYTAYTHQQNKPFAYWIKQYAMASTHSIEESKKYWDEGWRTFRITVTPEASKHEIICPNFTNGTQCVNCCLCNGKSNSKDNRKSITIPRH